MSKNLKEVDLLKIYNKWADGLGPFRCFLRATNFVSLKHYPDFQLNDIELTEGDSFEILEDIIDKYDIKTTLYFIDIPAVKGIKLGLYIQKLLNIKPILIFNNPLHPYGIVGDKDYISRLIGYGELLEKIEPSGFAFILDNYRYKECSDDELKCYFNNQYELTEDDLPYHYMLEELGFKRVVYIYKDEVKEDIAYYLDYLKHNSIEVEYKGINYKL
ncbi:hypothetical protein [Clostridium omnivorum]|uniref:Normocyte-binding protein n=1 Tax=Clostridium omnivorum TaxID=1604902 RepID=A0ABQ5N262_9CLOT|nr:hypothetical protein [Clostridium sp. E14]GLC29294.1 hypothetical protein bsdE14_07040 [Clostridium sp. E14]